MAEKLVYRSAIREGKSCKKNYMEGVIQKNALKLLEPLKEKYKELLFLHHTPEIGARKHYITKELQELGAIHGVWSLFLPLKKTNYSGLYILVKYLKHNGRLTKNQIEFGKFVSDNGFYTEVCYNEQQVYDCVLKYLQMQ